jgi:Winged helix DNA-binding domain
VGLWTRLAGFTPDDLKDLLTERIVVRAHLMRNTVHLVTAADYLSFRPLFQPPMDRALAGNFGRRLAGVDLAELREAARPLLAERPLTRTQLAAQLSARWTSRTRPPRVSLPPPRSPTAFVSLARFRNIQNREVSPRFVPPHI